MQRYFEADTTPAEERELARYAGRTDDPGFEELRGVLGYLSIGKEKKVRKARTIRMYSFAAVAVSIVAMVVIALSLGEDKTRVPDERFVRYAYGEKSTNREEIMTSVESSLADFFAGDTPAEANLIEMFQR